MHSEGCIMAAISAANCLVSVALYVNPNYYCITQHSCCGWCILFFLVVISLYIFNEILWEETLIWWKLCFVTKQVLFDWAALSILTAISRWTWVSQCLLKRRMVIMVVRTGAISCAELQSNHHHQQTQFFTGRMPFLSPNQQCLKHIP